VLPEVSHPVRWPRGKSRACIAYFYQQDDAAANGAWDHRSDSAPARLIPALGPCFIRIPASACSRCGVPYGPGVWKQSVPPKGAPSAGLRVSTRVQDKICRNPARRGCLRSCYPQLSNACGSTSPFALWILTCPREKCGPHLAVRRSRTRLALCRRSRVPTNHSNC